MLTGTDVGAITFVDHDEITGYMQSDGPTMLMRSLKRKLRKNWVMQQQHLFDSRLTEIYRLVQKAKDIQPSPHASKKILANIYRHACGLYPYSNAFYVVSKVVEKSLLQELTTVCTSTQATAIMALAGTPIKRTAVQQCQHDLVGITRRLEASFGIRTVTRLRQEYSRSRAVQRAVDPLVHRYRYLTALNAGERTAESFFSEIITARSVSNYKRHVSIPSMVRDEIRVLRTGAYFKDEISSAIIPRIKYELYDHWNMLAKHLKISFKDLEELTAEQVVLRSLTPIQANRFVIQQRRHIMFAHLPYKRTLVMRGTKAIVQDRLLQKQTKTVDPSITSFTGQIGSPGRTRGIVQVLTHSSHIRHFKKGRILVTVYTAPEYVPAMKQAKAIITDTGGITSHAAIVSRELNKPCIVNTNIATQLLHDGDLIEVNAHNGTITILNRK